jgi:hypothetical protein
MPVRSDSCTADHGEPRQFVAPQSHRRAVPSASIGVHLGSRNKSVAMHRRAPQPAHSATVPTVPTTFRGIRIANSSSHAGTVAMISST